MLSNNTIIISIDNIIYTMSELEFFQMLCRNPNMEWEYISLESLESTLNTMYESLYKSFKSIKFVEKTNSQKRR